MHSAQIDLDEKLSAQLVAENEAAADRVAVDATSADLAKYQAAVDKLAAAAYMGGRTDTLAAALTATSPQELIEQLAIQKTVASELTVQMAAFRSASARAATAADRSAKSAVQARTGPMRPRQCEPTLRPNSVECRSRLLRRYRSGCVRLLRVDQVGVPAEREVVAPVESGACSGRQSVATSDLQPGDIVTFYDDVSHAGMYIGDGMMVHASTYGTPVKVAPISCTDS